MSFVLHIGIGYLINFLSSIPFGTINLTVAETAVNKNRQIAFWVALGAAIVQIFQAFVSVKFSVILNRDEVFARNFIITSIPILIILGLYFLFKKVKPIRPATSNAASTKGFFKGALISTLNMVIIPFYIFLGGYLGEVAWFHLDNTHLLFFSIGAAFGSLTIFLIYIKLGVWIKERSEWISRHSSTMVAGILFVLAILQAIRLFV